MELSVYVDGSFSGNVVRGGYVVLYKQEPLVARRIIVSKPAYVTARNAAGELFSTMSAVSDIGEAVGDKKCVVTIYHDYNGIYEFIKEHKPWTANKPVAVTYKTFMLGFKTRKPNVELKFVKVKSHTGVKWNEVADCLAGGGIPYECRDIMEETVEYR